MIHPSAIIEEGAVVGDGLVAGPFAYVEAGAELGEGCILASHAVVRSHARLGPRVRVDSFAVVGGEPQSLGFDAAIPSTVEIGEGAILREGVTVHRASMRDGRTCVGAGSLLMACSHVGHDCEVGDHVILANNALLGGHVKVGPRAFISGNAVVHQHARIGELAMLSGLAGVGLDVPPFTIAADRNEIRGLNIVGIKRQELGPDCMSDLKACYRAVYMAPGDPRKLAAAALETGLPRTDAGRRFLAFFGESSRGIMRSPRRSGS